MHLSLSLLLTHPPTHPPTPVSGLIMAEKALISSTIRGTDWAYLLLLYLIVNLSRFLGIFLFFPTLSRGK